LDPDPLSLFLNLAVIESTFVLKVLMLLVLLICSALISGAEVAFFGLSPTDLNEIEEKKTVRGKIVVKLLTRPKKLLATILIANNAINIGIVLLFNSIGDTLFSEINYVLFGFISVRFLLEVLVATFLILMFGEILPKIYANRNRFQFSIFMAYPLKILDILFTPLSSPMRSATIFMYNRLGKQKSNLSVDHLSRHLNLLLKGTPQKKNKKS